MPSNPGADKARAVLGLVSSGGARDVFKKILENDEAGARALLRNASALLGDEQGGTEFNAFFSAARYLKDSAAVERLAKHAIRKAPANQKLMVCVQMLGRSAPCMDKPHYDSLVAYVEGIIQRQESDPSSANISSYYMRELDRLIGKKLKMPIDQIRAQVETALARGGYYLQTLGANFAMLDEEQYQVLLREAYRKAKASDRLQLTLNLIHMYPSKMDENVEETFMELAVEAAEESTVELLNAYRMANSNYYYRQMKLEDVNAEFRARVLEELARNQPEDKRNGLLIEQARAWQAAGNEGRALDSAKEAFRLSLEENAPLDSQLRRAFLPRYTQVFLQVIDEEAAKELEPDEPGPSDADDDDEDEDEEDRAQLHEKKRLELVKQGGDTGQYIVALKRAIERFPEEVTFRTDLKRQLDAMGRYYESIEVLEGLAALEPENDSHRAALEKSWQQLSHPINAKRYTKPAPEPKPEENNESKESTVPVPQKPTSTGAPRSGTTASSAASASVPVSKPASIPAVPATAKAQPAAPKSAASKKPEDQEKKVPPASIAEVKKHHDAEDFPEAQIALRRLWRNFPALSSSRTGVVFTSSSSSSSNKFAWPQKAAESTSATAPPPSSSSSLGGLEAFLVKRPILSSQQRASQQSQQNQERVSIFEAIGSETFVVDETDRWLRTLTKSQYQGQAFEEMITAVAMRRIQDHEGGIGDLVSSTLASAKAGDLSGLEQHVLLAVLELHPDAGGSEVSSYLEELVSSLTPSDQWKAVRLARCFAKRGELERALSLYKWCGTSVTYTPYTYYGMNPLTGSKLVREILDHLEGDVRLQALDTVLSLMTVDGSNSSSQMYFNNFVISTWSAELTPPEVFKRCRAICERVVDDYPSEQYKNPTSLEQATQILASGGDATRAVRGLQLLVVPDAQVNDSGQRVTIMSGGGMMISSSQSGSSLQPRVTDRMLQRWFPENSGNWAGGSWLELVASSVKKWADAGQIQMTDSVKLLALIAVRQHEAGLEAAAARTLAQLDQLDIQMPRDVVWLSDAARRCGDSELAMKAELALLEQRRLPIVRLAGLMRDVAEHHGAERALDLGREAAKYTWQPDFLGVMASVATKSAQPGQAAEWHDRQSRLLRLDPKPSRYGFVLGEGEEARLYRYQELETEPIVHDVMGETPVVIFFDPEKRAATAYERGNREFVSEGGKVTDASGVEWDLQTGTSASGKLKARVMNLVESDRWRAANPKNEVYLLSALDRAKTKYFEKGAEGWRYFDGWPPAKDWHEPAFDDSNWKTGKAPLGYGEPYIETTVSFGDDASKKNPSVYFRRDLEIDDPSQLAKLVGRLQCDDGAVVFLNGTEIFRHNLPEGAIEPTTNTNVSWKPEGQYHLFLAAPKHLVKGRNIIAVRVHQHDDDSSDLVMDLEMGALLKSDLKK